MKRVALRVTSMHHGDAPTNDKERHMTELPGCPVLGAIDLFVGGRTPRPGGFVIGGT